MAAQPAGQDGASAPGGSSLTAEPPPAYEEKNPQGPGTAAPPSTTQTPYNNPYVQQGLPQYGQQPQVQYMLPAPYPLVSAPPKPNFPGPHSYFVYVLLATVICGFLNVISLCFTIPALICVTMSTHQKSIGQYPIASKLSTAAFILTNIGVVFTLFWWIIFVGLIVGDQIHCGSIRYNQYDGYRCSRW